MQHIMEKHSPEQMWRMQEQGRLVWEDFVMLGRTTSQGSQCLPPARAGVSSHHLIQQLTSAAN